MNIISRQDAKKAGLKFYFTGKVCKHGHVEKRNVNNSDCVPCQAIRSKKWREDNVEKEQLRLEKHRKDNHKLIKLYQQKWNKDNFKRMNLLRKIWTKDNPEKVRLAQKKWSLKNPEMVAAKQAKGRATKRNAFDRLIPKEVFVSIEKQKYSTIKATGIPHHTDHFIPLSKGGMHTPSNLRIIPATVNLRKSSNIWSEKKLRDECRVYYKGQGLTPKTIDELIQNYNCANSQSTIGHRHAE